MSSPIKITFANLPEKFREVRVAINGNENLVSGWNFISKETDEFQNFQKIYSDEFTRQLAETWINQVNKFLEEKPTTAVLKEEDKGYSGYKFEGSKYRQTRNLGVVEIAKLIKEELQIIFDTLKISVSTDKFSGGQSIDITISNLDFNPFSEKFTEMYKEGKSEREIQDYFRGYYEKSHSEKYEQLRAKAEKIVNQYQMDDSDSQTDYFHVNFYDHIRIETDPWLKIINPQHPEILAQEERRARWAEQDKKQAEQRAKLKESYFKNYGGIFPKFALVMVNFKFYQRGKDPEIMNLPGFIQKSITPANAHRGISYYSVKVLQPTQIYDRETKTYSPGLGSRFYENISPSQISHLQGVEKMTEAEYITEFKRLAKFDNNNSASNEEEFKKWYEKKVKKAYQVQQAMLKAKPEAEPEPPAPESKPAKPKSAPGVKKTIKEYLRKSIGKHARTDKAAAEQARQLAAEAEAKVKAETEAARIAEAEAKRAAAEAEYKAAEATATIPSAHREAYYIYMEEAKAEILELNQAISTGNIAAAKAAAYKLQTWNKAILELLYKIA